MFVWFNQRLMLIQTLKKCLILLLLQNWSNTLPLKILKIDGIDIKAGNFIGINGKHILSCSENRLKQLKSD